MTIFSAISALSPILGKTTGPIWVVAGLVVIVGAIYLIAFSMHREED